MRSRVANRRVLAFGGAIAAASLLLPFLAEAIGASRDGERRLLEARLRLDAEVERLRAEACARRMPVLGGAIERGATAVLVSTALTRCARIESTMRGDVAVLAHASTIAALRSSVHTEDGTSLWSLERVDSFSEERSVGDRLLYLESLLRVEQGDEREALHCALDRVRFGLDAWWLEANESFTPQALAQIPKRIAALGSRSEAANSLRAIDRIDAALPPRSWSSRTVHAYHVSWLLELPRREPLEAEVFAVRPLVFGFHAREPKVSWRSRVLPTGARLAETIELLEAIHASGMEALELDTREALDAHLERWRTTAEREPVLDGIGFHHARDRFVDAKQYVALARATALLELARMSDW